MEENRIFKKYKNRDFSENIIDKNLGVVGRGIYSDNNNPKTSKYRYYLEIDLNNSKNNNCILIALLMNPSNTFPDCGFDKTIINVINLAKKCHYKNLIILNAFPLIQSNSKSAQKDYESNPNSKENKTNTEFIKLIFESLLNFEVLPACGNNVECELFNQYINILKNIKTNFKMWTYAPLTKAMHRPRHLSRRSPINMRYYNAFINDNCTNKQYLKIVNNDFVIQNF